METKLLVERKQIDDNKLIEQVARLCNTLGLDSKIINHVKVKATFGEGVEITFDTSEHFKVK